MIALEIVDTNGNMEIHHLIIVELKHIILIHIKFQQKQLQHQKKLQDLHLKQQKAF